MKERQRCGWCNLANPRYVQYHDEEWGVPTHDDRELFELLVLESFQAGLSWECVLNKRERFRQVFNGFDPAVVAGYGEEKIERLMADPGIIRNRRKIQAAVKNASVFLEIQREYGSFDRYLWGFTGGETVREYGLSNSPLSDDISSDLKRRGMSFVGSTVVYAYLQSAGVIDSHDEGCFLHYGREMN